jgi:hypothetical protein
MLRTAFRMQEFSRYQSTNLNHAIELSSNEVVDIEQALTIN